MRYSEIIVLIPSHSLEDFPTELPEDQAASLLNVFSVAWHPTLLAQTGTMFTWHRSDEPPDLFEGRLILMPTVCDEWLPAGWAERAGNEGARVVSGLTDRDEMIEAALGGEEQEVPDVHRDLVADFMAMGFCYLQLELLTRHMHHFSSMDEVHLQRSKA